MGFFQSLFNKEKGGIVKKQLVTTPNNKHTQITTMQNTSVEQQQAQQPVIDRIDSHHSNSSLLLPPLVVASNTTSPPTSPGPQLFNSNSPSINSSSRISSSILINNTTTKTPTPPISQRTSNETNRRFIMNEDGSHTHHLIQPPPTSNRITASLNGLLGKANKSLRLPHGWGGNDLAQQHQQQQNLLEIQKERNALNTRLHKRKSQENSSNNLKEKWGICQETIGKGTSGVVRVAHKQLSDGTEQLYAVKELRKKSNESSKDYIHRLTSEYYISSTVHHVNIIQTFDLLPLTETSPIFAQVMEYSGGGDLFDVLYDSPDGLDVNEANCFFKQLIRGVQYLHTIGVAHRDLKPENLLLTTWGCLKISDFGSAACFKGSTIDSDGEQVDNDEEDKIHLIHGLVGSEPYIAPEEFIQETYDARLVDVWSCGIIYMTMRRASHLWQVAKPGNDDRYDKYLKFRQLLDEERENARREHLKRKATNMTEQEKWIEKQKREAGVLKARETIRKRAKEGRFDTLEGIDIQAKKVIYRMLDPQPSKRMTAHDVLYSDWCQHIVCCQSDSSFINTVVE